MFAPRILLPLSTLVLSGICHASDSHQSLALELIQILSDTESRLRDCTDAASTSAAIPHLHKLSQQIIRLKERQQALPEPTVQDYIAAQTLVAEFNTLAQAIQQHIERLLQEKLISPELRQILAIPQS